MTEICRHGGFRGTLTQEDDELVSNFLQRLFSDYKSRKLNDLAMIPVMTTWFGIPFGFPATRVSLSGAYAVLLPT